MRFNFTDQVRFLMLKVLSDINCMFEPYSTPTLVCSRNYFEQPIKVHLFYALFNQSVRPRAYIGRKVTTI
ncbi:hypothetical protein BDQ17DRAFT_1353997 [Cyathus striatus]|nr:hypothetical protein BDQ17DRAFT_1353997 [Cyathus striatus]